MMTDVEPLIGGDHRCAMYRSGDELDALVSAHVDAAAADGWHSVVLHRLDTAAFYGDRPAHDPAGIVADFEQMARSVVAAGHRGLAVAADATELVRTADGRANFARVEHLADRMIRATGLVTGLCVYDAEAIGPDAVDDLGALHQHSWPHDTPFHLCADGDDGVRLDGELDLSTVGALSRVLAAIDNSTTTDLVVDVSDLHFVDHRSLRLLDAHAQSQGRRIELRGARPIVARLVGLLALEHVLLADLR